MQFAPESLASAGSSTPSGPGVVTSSAAAGWTSVLLAVCEGGDGDGAAFEPVATPDHLLVLSLNGPSEIECYAGGRWRRAVREAGSCGLTPSGGTDRLRRRVLEGQPIRTAHLYIPPTFFDGAREHFRRAGARADAGPLDALGFRDATVAQVIHALTAAARAGAPDLYAQTAAQFLATHLLTPGARWPDGSADWRGAGPRTPGPLTDRRLARAIEYMTAHAREPLTLDQIAAEAGVSKFHLVRLFKRATGESPHAFLVGLRLDAARQMLRDTELPVAAVARASGYASAAQFASAFARRAGCTPSAYRRAARGRPAT